MKLPQPLLTAVTEALRYNQRSQLYQLLTAMCHDYLEGKDPKAILRASDIIKHETHMDIRVEVFEASRPAAFILHMQIDPNHILRDPSLLSMEGERVSLRAFAQLLKEVKASVDENGAVYGAFTKFPATLYLANSLMDGSFSPEEIAALMLHEIGHQYSYFDMMGRTLLGSVAIAQLEEQLASTDALEDRTHYLANTAMVLDLSNVDARELADPDKAGQVRYVFIRDFIAKLAADQGSERVFNGEAEFLADSYAVRQGAAKPLVSAYVKLAKAHRDPQFLSKKAHVATEATKAALTILTVGAASTIFLPVTMTIGTVIAGMMMSVAAQDLTERNTPAERLEAIHHDLVAILKDRSLPKGEQNAVLHDIEYVSMLSEEVRENQTLLGMIMRSISGPARKRYKQIEFQRELGRLIHNDLFVKAAQLKQLASKS